MKLNVNEETQTNCQIENKMFSIQASPIAFDILSNKLYSNPILAVVRELLTNAYDSHKAANNIHIPIDVHFPDYLDKNFTIRDYGTGLCKEDIMEMYTTFFSSTKSDTNDFTGCFGLGSKTPFSYVPAFSINSYWNGTKYYFAAVKKDGYPNIYCIREEETTEPNGLEIIIPTSNDPRFYHETTRYLKYIPEIKINSSLSIDIELPLYKQDDISVYKLYESYNKAHDNILIKQGQNIYKIPNPSIFFKIDCNYIFKIAEASIILIEVPIGTLDITPSRENLSQEANNNDILIELIFKIEEHIENIFLHNTEIIKKLNYSLYIKMLIKKYNLEDIKHLTIKAPHLNSDATIGAIRVSHGLIDVYTENYKDNKNNSFIEYNPNTLIVYTSEQPTKRSITRIKNIIYNYSSEIGDQIVVISPHQYENLKEFIKYTKNIFNKLCSVEEFDLHFRIMNINQFFKKYPNHKKPVTRSCNVVINEDSYVRYKIYTYKDGVIESNGGNRIKNIKDKISSKNTILLPMTSFNDYNQESKLIANLITEVINNDIIFNFIKGKKSNLEKSDDIQFILIAKSNFKYFKEYAKVDVDKLILFLQKTKWSIKYVSNDLDTEIIDFLRNFKNILTYNFKNKTKYFVYNSKIYKRIESLIKLNDKYIKFSIRDLAYFKSIGIPNNFINYKNISILDKELQLLYDFYKDTIMTYRIVQTFRNNNRIVLFRTYLLNKEDKTKILTILKGEKKNVLFC